MTDEVQSIGNEQEAKAPPVAWNDPRGAATLGSIGGLYPPDPRFAEQLAANRAHQEEAEKRHEAQRAQEAETAARVTALQLASAVLGGMQDHQLVLAGATDFLAFLNGPKAN